MLHEVLFSLLGHGIFAVCFKDEEVGNRENLDLSNGFVGLNDGSLDLGLGDARNRRVSNVNGDFRGNKALKFMVPAVISNAEAEIVNELAMIGDDYRGVCAFVEKFGRPTFTVKPSSDSRQRQSLVRQRLCSSIRTVFLDDYVNLIEKLEAQILKEPVFPLSRIKLSVTEAGAILKKIRYIGEQIDKKSLIGGQIIDFLYEELSKCGFEGLRSVLEVLLCDCANTILNMTSVWMSQGIPIDPADEFFVKERPYDVHTQFNQSSDSMDFIGAERTQMETHDWIPEYDWRSRIRLRPSLLPKSFIGLELANNIIFTGKAARVLKRYQNSTLPPDDNHSTSDDDRIEMNPALQFAKASKQVSDVIRRKSALAAKRIRTLIVSDARLFDHLSFFREFFLLGRGGFTTIFLHLCKLSPLAYSRLSLKQIQAAIYKGPWHEAAVQSGLDTWPEFIGTRFDKLRPVFQRPAIEFDSFAISSVSSGTGQMKLNAIESSHASDLAFVGDSVWLQKPYDDTDGIHIGRKYQKTGGIWHVDKIKVEEGFSGTISYSLTTTDFKNTKKLKSGVSCIALCIQHDPFFGPTALNVEGELPWSDLKNFVCFGARFYSTLDLVELFIDGTLSQASSSCKAVQLPDLSIQEGQRFTIEYTCSAGAECTKDSKQAAISLQLTNSDQIRIAELHSNSNIFSENIFVPEIGSGRAWVGILGAPAVVGDKSISFVINSWKFKPKLEVNDPWRDLLSLQTKVEWPLHLVFTQNVLDQYNTLFRFLLSISRADHALKGAWANLNLTEFRRPNRNRPRTSFRLMLMWRLRSMMSFLVNNLLFHIQADVIDSQEKELLKTIEYAGSFAVVEKSHARFLERLTSASYLHHRRIRMVIQEVLQHCMNFCELVERFVDSRSESENNNEAWDTELSNLATSFQDKATLLHVLLGKYNSHLLLRLDYNGHLSALANKKCSYKVR